MRSESILFHFVFWWRVGPVASNFRLHSCICCRYYLAFKLTEAVREMSLFITFRHNATKVKKFVDLASCSLVFKLRLLSQKILYACLASNSMICVHRNKKSLSTQIISQLSQVFRGILQSCRVSCCAFKLVLLFEELFDAKVQPIGHAVTQNYVFCSLSIKTNQWQFQWLIDQTVKETKVMKIIMQFRTNVNYMAYISACLIEICNTHTTTFGYQTHFFHNSHSSYI